MKAYYFRFMNDDGLPTGWVGLVVGKTMDEIFECIDEYGDPYTVQIQTAKKGGFCVQWKLFEDGSGDAVMENPAEVSDHMPWFDDQEGWVTPPWVTSDWTTVQ